MKILLACFILVTTLFAISEKTTDTITGLLDRTKHNPSQIMRTLSGSWTNSKYIQKHEARLDIDRRGRFKTYLPNRLKNSDGMPIGSHGKFWIYEDSKATCSTWKSIVEKNGVTLNKAYPDLCKTNKSTATAIVLETGIGDRTLSKGFWYLAKFDFTKKKMLTLTNYQGTGKWYVPTDSPQSVKDKKAFSDAVYSNDIAKMKQLLQGDTQIDMNKMYLLAIEVGNLETVKLILTNGADLNYKTSFENPAARASCDDANINKIKYLLSFGYNYEQKYLKDRSPIYAAAQCRQVKLIDFWIDKGIDINLEKSNGQTPLFDVCRNRKNIFAGIEYDDTTKLLKTLIAKGADPLHKDKKNVTLLHAISAHGSLSQIKYVKSFFKDINIQEDFLQTPLHYAVRDIPYDQKQLKYEVVQYLVSIGADKSIKDKMGRTAYDIVKKMSFPKERMLVLLKP